MNDAIFKTILTPVDFSEVSAHALRAAAAIASGTDATIVAAYANWFEAPPYFTAARTAEIAAEFRESTQLAAESLAKFVDSALGGWKPHVELRVVDALPVDAILGLIGRTSADLVVMGTHGWSGMRKWMLGSVAEAVIRESPVPVLTVRGAGPAGIRRVLCAVDDTAVSRLALTVAARLSARLGAGLTALHVAEPGKPQAVEDLCAAIPPGERARCSIRETLRHGNAAEEILRAAVEEGSDLIVLGAPRRAFFEGMVLGTNTVRTVRHAPCPVLTVPPASHA